MEDVTRYLIVSLDGEGYAVPVARVAEIATSQGLEPDRNLTAAFEGKIEFRGRRIPVLNLKKLLRLQGEAGKAMLVLRSEKGEVGILVDAVTEILDTDKQAIPLPPGVINPSLRYYRGILRHRGGLILLLNEDGLL